MPVSTLRKGLPYELPPRMLQRRLTLLIEQKRLIADGQGKGRHYRFPVARSTGDGNLIASGMTAKAHAEDYVPISPEADVIRQAVRAPIQNRRPVGYQRDFLDDYRPDETYNLPSNTRQRLLEQGRPEQGRPPDGERPAGTYARTIYSCLLVDLSWNSSRLDVNTYSLLETERLLELGEAAEGKDSPERADDPEPQSRYRAARRTGLLCTRTPGLPAGF